MIENPSFPSSQKKEALRKQIRRDLEKFLSTGGDIKKVGEGVSGYDENPKFNVKFSNA